MQVYALVTMEGQPGERLYRDGGDRWGLVPADEAGRLLPGGFGSAPVAVIARLCGTISYYVTTRHWAGNPAGGQPLRGNSCRLVAVASPVLARLLIVFPGSTQLELGLFSELGPSIFRVPSGYVSVHLAHQEVRSEF